MASVSSHMPRLRVDLWSGHMQEAAGEGMHEWNNESPCFSLSTTSSLSKINTSIKKIEILNEKQVRHKIKSKMLVHYIVLV